MNTQTRKSEATIQQAIQALNSKKPEIAEQICQDYLNVHSSSVEHLRLLGHALQLQNKLVEAEDKFRLALKLAPKFAPLSEDLGHILALQEKLEEAIPHFEYAIKLDGKLTSAHKKLGQALASVGRGKEADEVFEVYFEKDPSIGLVAMGIEHLQAGRENEAVESFRAAFKKNPDSVDAMRFLATAYIIQDKKLGDAEALLRRVVQMAPEFALAWSDLGHILIKTRNYMEGIESYKKAIELMPGNFAFWLQLASCYATAGYPEEAAEAYSKAIEINPSKPSSYLGYGHALKTLGDQKASLNSYREAIRLKPDFGEVYWSMANLKIFKFEKEEVKSMKDQLANSQLKDGTEVHFRFALGKAYEDAKDYDKAWEYYHSGNELQRKLVEYDPAAHSERHERARLYFSSDRLKEAEGYGYPDEAPIFIVGLGRSGSTLVEQILASHSQVEGTEELSVLGKVSDTVGRYRNDKIRYPIALDDMRPQDWRGLGLNYLEGAKRYR
ncbi:MAG: tetratricopeptide repeat protein, partial [Emcibacteraceae bacterium]|nr:tetratricopeptide repeat protein [Emcibacteraceae bacterium]